MKEILNFELHYRLSRPATWIYFTLGLLIATLLAVFEQSGTAEYVNSPNNITSILVPVSVIAIFFYAAIMGVPVYRDAEHKTAETYFTFPINPKSYILGRFLGSYLIASLVNVGIVVGAMLGFGIGAFLDRPDFGTYTAFSFSSYILPYLFILQSNALLIGALFFGLMAFFKKMPIIYLGGIILFLLYNISGDLLSNLDNQWLSVYLDPFGGRVFSLVKKYWSINELNTNSLPLYGKFLFNRVLWLSIAIILFLITLFKFDYKKFLTSSKQKQHKQLTPLVTKNRPLISQEFNAAHENRNLLSLSKIEILSIIKDPIFLILLIIGILVALFTVFKGNETYGTPNLPLTRYVIMYISGGLSLLSIIILVIYAGEAVHRTRNNKTFVFYDALPISNNSLYYSKVIALISTATLLTLLNIVVAVLYQTINGYFTYELGMQFVYNFAMIFPGFIMTILLAFFIHVLVNNKFLGHFVVIALYIGLPLLVTLAFKSNNPMLIFTGATSFFISDLNGFGHYLTGIFWLNLYWILATLILMILGKLFWTRGFTASFKERCHLAIKRLKTPTKLSLSIIISIFIAVAGYTYYNLKVLNTIHASTYADKTGAQAEKKYAKYIDQLHPVVTDLKAFIDIYPNERNIEARGEFIITNPDLVKSIDTLLLEMQYPNMHTKLKRVVYNGVELEPVYKDSIYRLFLYKLPEALIPSTDAKLTIEVNAETRGFANEMETQVLNNGSFLNNQIFPRFHYDRSVIDNGVRRKYNLDKLDYILPPRSDAAAVKKNLFNEDANYINFEATVSTSSDQIAIAPGKLKRKWIENDRAFYHYQLESKTNLFFNVVSAKYDVEQSEWVAPSGKKVMIEIYHSPKHKKNLKHFIEGAKVALHYCSANFMEYPNSVLRIVEFPAHSVFAQSFATTIPYSENFGFAADFDRAEDFNYAFRITTHEVAHQWWGHLVTPSKTSGANIISETLSEYTSLMTMKQKYGENGIKNFLKYSLDDYLRSRSFSFKPERTLLNVETGQHIWYRKGSMIMYHLQDVIGEEKMNTALKKFSDEFKYYNKKIYPTSQDLYNAIREITPDSLKYLVDDGFNEIVLYENRVNSASTEKQKDASFKTTVTVTSKKIYYNDSGKEKYVDSTANYIEIGLFGEDIKDTLDVTLKNPYYLERKWLQPGDNTFTIYTKEKPLRAGIDPYNKLIDRDSEDNLKSIEE
ncbi:M1 family aminopeptidase [Aquimarina sp. W85]|uniref:ABC transporter permease/M1 family aminopeptidase n=1 Tax=Aquimarina rhodophyticola TaxID=3342246 RepID=UPI00366CB3C9